MNLSQMKAPGGVSGRFEGVESRQIFISLQLSVLSASDITAKYTPEGTEPPLSDVPFQVYRLELTSVSRTVLPLRSYILSLELDGAEICRTVELLNGFRPATEMPNCPISGDEDSPVP